MVAADCTIVELLDVLPWDDTYKDVRARTIILMFYTTGMRLSELIALDDADVSFGSREVKVTGKRDKQRIIPFGDELEQALREYIENSERVVVMGHESLDPDAFGAAVGIARAAATLSTAPMPTIAQTAQPSDAASVGPAITRLPV